MTPPAAETDASTPAAPPSAAAAAATQPGPSTTQPPASAGSPPPPAVAAAAEKAGQGPVKRPVCASCGRPLRVCYCAALPPEPVVLAGHVVILQHPQELKRPLATVPMLSKVLHPSSLTLLVGRRIRPGAWEAFDRLAALVQQQQVPLLVLFPGPGAEDLQQVAERLQQQQGGQQQQDQQQQTSAAATQQGVNQPSHTPAVCQADSPQQAQQQPAEQPQPAVPAYVLLLLDGTWRQAREMFDALDPWMVGPEGLGQQVQLPHTRPQQQQPSQPPLPEQLQQQKQPPDCATPGAPPAAAAAAAAAAAPPPAAALSQRDAKSKLRSEPAEGCCTTLEAAAAAVALLEARPGLFDVCMAPLRLLTQQQAGFDPAVAARVAPGGSGVVASKKRLGMRGRLD